MGQGKQFTVDPEIYDICFWKSARYGWSTRRIAEYLLNEHGIENERQPGRPVHASTVMRWAAKGEEQLTEDYADRHKVEIAMAYVELDAAKEMLHDIVEQTGIASLDEVAKLIDMVTKLRNSRNQTFALHSKIDDLLDRNTSGIDLDPETRTMLSQLEQQTAQHTPRYRLYVDNR